MNKKHHKTIKILNKIKVLFHRIFTNKLFKDSINIIITSIIATLIATIIIDNNNKKHTDFALKEKMLYDLQTICIGCNKDWMDAAFGTPVFTNKENSIIEEIYITEIAIIRAFFGAKDNACKMFFITQTSQELIPFIPTINNSYFNITGKEKKLGILSYKEINDIDIELVTAYGFYTNGTGRTFYGESYNCFSTSQHDIYFASLDYGTNNPWMMMDNILSNNISKKDLLYYKNLNDTGLNQYHNFLTEREKFYPNTYGISSLDSDYTFNKLMDYNTFDSIEIAYRAK